MARERRVLLVEDDPVTAELYLGQLRRDGVPIEHVATREAADAFMRRRLPVLVLMDLSLPDGGGRELAEAWAVDPLLNAIPVWIISNADPHDNPWWHNAPNVHRYFKKSQVALGRLSAEIRVTLGLPLRDHARPQQLAS